MRRPTPRRAALLLAPILLALGLLAAIPAAEAQSSGCFTTPRVTGHTTWPRPTGPSTGEFGTTIDLAVDGQQATWFQSSHDNWQYLQLDFGCVGELRSIDRLMSKNGRISGVRSYQGEGVSYSTDGRSFTELTGATTSGWERYTNYRPQAWHSVGYGWSGKLKLDTPARARYVRFNWDGNADALNELLVDWREAPVRPVEPIDAGLRCESGQVLCDSFPSGGTGGPYTFEWRTVSNVTNLRETPASGVGQISTATGLCDPNRSRSYTMEVTVSDSAGRSDTERLSRPCDGDFR